MERILGRRLNVGVDRLTGVLGVEVACLGCEHTVGFLEMSVIGRGRQLDVITQPSPTVIST